MARQLLLPFPSLAGGRTWSMSMTIDCPASIDPKLIQRLDQAGKRIGRGAQVGPAKLRKLTSQLESIAGLFDGDQ